jgi:hypothetical protein
MILRQILRVSSEELRKAKGAILRANRLVRELDERTLAFLLVLLGIG